MVVAQGVLIEEHRVEIWSVFRVFRVALYLCFVFVYDGLIFQVQVEQNLLVVLLEKVGVYTARFEDAKRIAKGIFKVKVVFRLIAEFNLGVRHVLSGAC